MTSANTTGPDEFEPVDGHLPVEPTPTYDEVVASVNDQFERDLAQAMGVE